MLDDYFKYNYRNQWLDCDLSEYDDDNNNENSQLNDISQNRDPLYTYIDFNGNNSIKLEDIYKEQSEKISTKIPLNQNNNISNDINLDNLTEINFYKKNEKKKDKKSPTKKGRKKKSSQENEKHNKYYEDNIIRKIKAIILSSLSSFINSIINKVYNGNIGKGIFKKELLKMNQNQVINLKSDKEFINKELKDIFSNDISTKFSSFLPNHNKYVIEKLLSENDIEKRKIFENIFSLTFLECIMHIRGTKYYKELEGLESLDNICKQFEDDNDYVELFKYYVFHFEEIIMNKKHRNSFKKDK